MSNEAVVKILDPDGAVFARVPVVGSAMRPLTKKDEQYLLDRAERENPGICSGRRLKFEWTKKGTT